MSAGFHYRSQAIAGTAPASFSSQAPQYINVYENKADVPLTVNVNLAQETVELYQVTLRPEGPTGFYAEVGVTASPPPSVPPGTIMITSNLTPVEPIGFGGENDAYTKITNPSGDAKFAIQLSLTRDTGGTWFGGAVFGPIPIIYASHGSVFGHLPNVGRDEFPEGGMAPLFAEYKGATGQLRFATTDDMGGASSPNANEFDAASLVTVRGDHGALFFGPDKMSFTERLDKIGPVVAGDLSAYMTPDRDIVDGGSDYVWPSVGVQEPIFKYTDPGAVDAQNQASFYSGIAFGVAGSAAIALVQEIGTDSEERKRKSSKSGARKEAGHP